MGEEVMFEYAPGATPLDPDEAAGLIPKHITTQSQLNEWEQVNILEAEKWVSQKNFYLDDIVTPDFIKKLHKRMFDSTWSWAGTFRKTNKNIGIDWPMVSINLRRLMDDVRYQIENKTYSMNEFITRFHYRLVEIHPFANGNGRHARLMADIILLSQGHQRLPHN